MEQLKGEQIQLQGEERRKTLAEETKQNQAVWTETTTSDIQYMAVRKVLGMNESVKHQRNSGLFQVYSATDYSDPNHTVNVPVLIRLPPETL